MLKIDEEHNKNVKLSQYYKWDSINKLGNDKLENDKYDKLENDRLGNDKIKKDFNNDLKLIRKLNGQNAKEIICFDTFLTD